MSRSKLSPNAFLGRISKMGHTPRRIEIRAKLEYAARVMIQSSAAAVSAKNTWSQESHLSWSRLAHRKVAWVFITSSLVLGCESAPPEPVSHPSPASSPQDRPERKAGSTSGRTEAGGDPMKGQFTLAQATAGLPEKGKLLASIETDLGTLSCELYDDKAPVTVANFIGLARGLRPFHHDGSWHTKPAYDGTTFHRVIKGFMIQGGDPEGSGKGEPGYVIEDEIWSGAKHDQRGLLCMANRGPNTNGMQFFITDAAAAHLDGGYTIFGKCSPDSTIEKLAGVETYGRNAGPGNRPDQPLHPPQIKKVTIDRK